MWIPDELKVNKFEDVKIPSNKAYFSRFGDSAPLANQYTGDEVAPIGQSKVDQIIDYKNYADTMADLDSKLSKPEKSE